jgi:predicted ATPase
MLLGRAAELAALETLLERVRLVTVTGVGGVGKTSLALAAAPGATVCELAGVARGDEVDAAVADVLGYPSLAAALVGTADVEALVVLDNCEHVLDAAAELVHRVLAGCPRVTVLATSRERLDVSDEHVFPLLPLAVPVSDDPVDLHGSPAIELLVDRARAAGCDLTVDVDGADLGALCRRLDGLPLALELAAARTTSLTPAEILIHLEQRQDLLARRRSRGPRRHRSLDTAIAWSHDRVPEATRTFFDRLGVFAGRFTAEQAAAVAGDDGVLGAVGHLDRLVAASLVTVRAQAGQSWYGLLDTLRAYARARLTERGELDEVVDRWVEHLADHAGRLRWGADPAPGAHSWNVAAATQTDVIEALRWCRQHDPEPTRAVRLVRQLAPVVYNARSAPVAALGEQLLARWPDPHTPAWAEFAAVTAFAQMALRAADRAESLARRVLDASPSPFAAVLAARTLYLHEMLADRPEPARRWAEHGIAVADRGNEPGWACELRTLLAGALAASGQPEDAAAEAARAQDEASQAGSDVLSAWAALAQASLLTLRDPDAGRVALQALAARSRSIGYPLLDGAACWGLAGIALLEDRPDEAARWLQRALEVFVRISGPPLLVTLSWAAATADAAGRADTAAALRHAAGPVRTLAILEHAWRDRLRGRTGPRGTPPLPLRDAVALARGELAGLAIPPRPVATPDVAPRRFVRRGAVWTLVYAGRTVVLPDAKGLRDLAHLLARAGQEVHCTELAGAAVDQPDTGPTLDAQARRAYEARIVELQGQLSEAEDLGDRGRADAARLGLDLMVDQLAAATGLAGRSRRTGSTAERARATVSWRVRAALRRIAEVHPELAEHLRAALRIGVWSRYCPVDPVDWDLADEDESVPGGPARTRRSAATPSTPRSASGAASTNPAAR